MRRLAIDNVRLGHANNSSSTHSLIFLPDAETADRVDDPQSAEFGWNYFTASSAGSKRDYLSLMLYANLRHMTNDAQADAIIREWIGTLRPQNGYIDHQSVYSLPCSWDGLGLDAEFFAEFRDFLMQGSLAVLGGNDNTDGDHSLGPGFELNMPQDQIGVDYVARKDERAQSWTLFNRHTGAKFRMRFDADSTLEPAKSAAPELVDVKITQHCPFGCPFCYQGSTAAGGHADFNRLAQLAHALGELKVFEVALGGGEPTLHPQFIGILRAFRHEGVVPNFTTKNLAWLRKPTAWVPIMEQCGSFAYSAGSDEEVAELARLIEDNGISRERVSVQVVMGTMNQWQFSTLIKEVQHARLRLTLLGYKTSGFGKDFQPTPYPWWGEEVAKSQCRVAIDTALALESEPWLKRTQVPRWLYHTKEGAFSCYIDAVKDKIAPSSYCEPSAYRSLASSLGLADSIMAAYAEF